MLLSLAIACTPLLPAKPAEPGPFHEGAPGLVGVEATCDRRDGRWAFAVRTDAWTDDARLWMAVNPRLVERHNLPSVRAAADGSWDCLEQQLGVAPNWQDAAANSTSRFRCPDLDALSFLITVTGQDTEGWTGCAAWGPGGVDWSAVQGAPRCDTTLRGPSDTGDTGAATPLSAFLWGDLGDCG